MSEKLSQNGSKIEFRKNDRKDCLCAGTIRFYDVFIANCVIKDISETGLRIFVPADMWIPGSFHIHAKPFEKPRLAKIKWRSGELLGAKFIA